MEKVFFDSLFFLLGIPIAYVATAIISMINKAVRDNAAAREEKGVNQ